MSDASVFMKEAVELLGIGGAIAIITIGCAIFGYHIYLWYDNRRSATNSKDSTKGANE